MPRSDDQPLSVAQVLEMVPADDSWVNEGFVAIVRSVKQSPANAKKKYWTCVLGDETGSAAIGMTIFFAPKFREQDRIEVTGQGIKRTEFNGAPKVSVGQKTEIHVRHRPSPPPTENERQQQQEPPPAGSQPTNGAVMQPVDRQIVCLAITGGLELVTRNLAGDDLRLVICGPQFWSRVHMAASDIIRLSRMLEKGKLAPPVRDRERTS